MDGTESYYSQASARVGSFQQQAGPCGCGGGLAVAPTCLEDVEVGDSGATCKLEGICAPCMLPCAG
eukprot:2436739-Alexandrium_andersonii.AAC.1